MHSSHGMGYAEYNSKLENRLEVEKTREKEYLESQQLVSTLNSL